MAVGLSMTATETPTAQAEPEAGLPVEEIAEADMQIGRPGAAPEAEHLLRRLNTAQEGDSDLPGFLAGQQAQRPTCNPYRSVSGHYRPGVRQ